jgi:hypothetical protein
MSEKCKLVTSLNLRRNALSQYVGYDFNSTCRFNGKTLAASSEGIFELDSGDTFKGASISAFFELIKTNFGYPGAKRLRKIYVGGYCSGQLLMECTPDRSDAHEYTISPSLSNAQYLTRVDAMRTQHGAYWTFKFSNSAGSDFSVDSVDVIVNLLARGKK